MKDYATVEQELGELETQLEDIRDEIVDLVMSVNRKLRYELLSEYMNAEALTGSYHKGWEEANTYSDHEDDGWA